MKQHIKVRARYNPASKKVELTILEQSHRCDKNFDEDFGNTKKYGCGAFEHKGWWLVSDTCPELYVYDQELFVRGNSSKLDDSVIILSLDHWSKIKPLIEAYNKWGETQ